MSGRIAGAGNSKGTRVKEGFFGVCLSYHLARTNRYIAKLKFTPPYFHLDLNAGNGYNPISNTLGSPLVFRKQASKYPQMKYYSKFIEKDRGRFQELESRFDNRQALLFRDSKNIFLPVRGDNEQYLKQWVSEVSQMDKPQFACGSIICDPNGFTQKRGMVQLDTFREVAQKLPNMMLLIFSPSGQAQRCIGYRYGTPKKTDLYDRTKCSVLTVDDFLSMRPYWLIGMSAGRKHVYLCGTKHFYPGFGPAIELTSETGLEFYNSAHGSKFIFQQIKERKYWNGNTSAGQDISTHGTGRDERVQRKYPENRADKQHDLDL